MRRAYLHSATVSHIAINRNEFPIIEHDIAYIKNNFWRARADDKI